MELIGKIEEILEEKIRKDGDDIFSYQYFNLKVDDESQQIINIVIWAKMIDLKNFIKGDKVRVEVTISSYQNRGFWHTTVRALRMEKICSICNINELLVINSN
ncbi:MAG: DUF3127 domain-containing protein [Bacteroidales bacterium]|nr:DUF3127 domain-containing protein [Bacteroidales bacterium]